MVSMRSNALYCFFLCIAFVISCDSDDQLPAEKVPVAFDGSIVVRSQADVEKLREKKYTHITGDLQIGPAAFDAPTNITDLSPLSELTRVDGNLVLVSNNHLTNFKSFGNLREVGMLLVLRNMFGITNLDDLRGLTSVGSLMLEHNPNLVSLAGLEKITLSDNLWLINHEKLSVLPDFPNITKLKGGLFLDTNPMLTEISAFGSLKELEGSLYFRCQPNTLTSFGLNNLERVGKWIIIEFLEEGDTKLTSLESLSNLASVGSEIRLTNLDALTSLHGLHNIESIRQIEIDDLNKLEKIDAFEKVTAVSRLHVLRNASLQSLEGFKSITQRVGTEVDVAIVDNPLLSDFCDIKPIVSLPDCTVEISGNAKDPTIEEIQGNCD